MKTIRKTYHYDVHWIRKGCWRLRFHDLGDTAFERASEEAVVSNAKAWLLDHIGEGVWQVESYTWTAGGIVNSSGSVVVWRNVSSETDSRRIAHLVPAEPRIADSLKEISAAFRQFGDALDRGWLTVNDARRRDGIEEL